MMKSEVEEKTRAQRIVGYLGDPDFQFRAVSVRGRDADLQSRKSSGSAVAPALLLAPFAIQFLWFAGGAIYAARQKGREPIVGILLGFAVKGVALVILIVVSASAHF